MNRETNSEGAKGRSLNINLRWLFPHRSRRWLAIPAVITFAGIVPENGSLLCYLTMFLGSTYLGFLISCSWQNWIPRLVLVTVLPLLISTLRIFTTWVAEGENLWGTILMGHHPTLIMVLLPLIQCVGTVVGAIWNESGKPKRAH